MPVEPASDVGRPPDWHYLLAHHFPNRYSRTISLRIGGRTYHFCARCSGELLGFVALLTLFLVGPGFGAAVSTPWAAVLLGICPSVSMADWLTQTVRGRESNNPLRVVSGFLLGVAFGGLVAYGLSRQWLFFGGGLVVLGAYLVGAAAQLYRTGSWRRVIEEHFP